MSYCGSSANVAEDDLADQGNTNSHVKALRAKAAEEGRSVVIVSAQVQLLTDAELPLTLTIVVTLNGGFLEMGEMAALML